MTLDIAKINWLKVGYALGLVILGCIVAIGASISTYLSTKGATDKSLAQQTEQWRAFVVDVMKQEENTYTAEEVAVERQKAAQNALELRARLERDAGIDGSITTLQAQVQEIDAKQQTLSEDLSNVKQAVDETKRSVASIANRLGAEPPRNIPN